MPIYEVVENFTYGSRECQVGDLMDLTEGQAAPYVGYGLKVSKRKTIPDEETHEAPVEEAKLEDHTKPAKKAK